VFEGMEENTMMTFDLSMLRSHVDGNADQQKLIVRVVKYPNLSFDEEDGDDIEDESSTSDVAGHRLLQVEQQKQLQQQQPVGRVWLNDIEQLTPPPEVMSDQIAYSKKPTTVDQLILKRLDVDESIYSDEDDNDVAQVYIPPRRLC
jgi:hypothetical protein